MSSEPSNETAAPEKGQEPERQPTFASDVLQRLNVLAVIVGALSAIVSLVSLYARGNTAIVFWSAGIVAIAVVAIIVTRLATGRKTEVPVLAAIAGIIVLAAAAVGGIIVFNARPSAHLSAATAPVKGPNRGTAVVPATNSNTSTSPPAVRITTPAGQPIRHHGPLTMLGDSATSYDLDSTASDWGAATGSWVSQNIQYFPDEPNQGPTLNIANEPVDDVVLGKGTNWTYSDCANAHYDATYHPNPNYVFGANIAPGTAVCVKTANTATKNDGGHYALIEIVRHSDFSLTIRITVWT